MVSTPAAASTPQSMPEALTVRVITTTIGLASLPVSVRDRAGQPVDAELSFVGPEDVDPVRTGADGEHQVALRRGEWQVIARTETLGPARASVQLVSGREADPVELVLAEARVALTAEAAVIEEQVPFDFGKATLRADADAVLTQVADALLSQAGIIRVEVQGHTDNVGEVAYNQTLSQRRAEAVLRALVERGVPPEKLMARGYGTQRPVADNQTDEGRAANRRVEFEIVEQAEQPTAVQESP